MLRSISISLVSLMFLTSCGKKNDLPDAPKPVKIAHETKLEWGAVQIDNYAWMRDKDWPSSVKDSKILDHLEAENKYAEEFFLKENDAKEKLFTELKSRIKLTDQTVYTKRDDYFYYTRTEENKAYPIYCRKNGSMDAEEEIILDVNQIAEGKKFAEVEIVSVSPDHKLLAYSVDFTGEEKYMVKVLNLENKEYLPDLISDTKGGIIWHEKLSGFFYVLTNEEMRCDKVMFHELGSDVSKDKTILQENDKFYYLHLGMTNSREFAVIESATHGDTESYIISLKNEDISPTLVKARQLNIKYEVEHNGDYIYLHINDTGPNMRLVRCNIRDLANNIWKEYIPQDNQKYLKNIRITANYLILNYRYEGLPLIKILHLYDSVAKIVTLQDSIYNAEAYSTNFVEDDLRVNYSSLVKPDTIYSYDFNNGRLTALKEREVPGYKSTDYQVERVWTQHQGVSIPISLYYKKSLLKKDGSNPLYLYGYGAYGIAIPPKFNVASLSLVDRGFIFAIAHVRGGDDLGYRWYEGARLLSKKKTFEDFIACAEFLVEEKYTKPQNIVISGGSAGGLLVTASANMRQDLFKAVIATHPSVDILNSLLDERLHLTPTGYKEYGNPHEKDYYDYIKSYSPYDNIGKHNYPNIFVLNGLLDPRVGYWEAAKYVAKIRELKTNDSIILLKTNMEAGHFGSSDRFEHMKEYAEQYAFIFKIFGIKPFDEEKK
jgi:oligopeptidase B